MNGGNGLDNIILRTEWFDETEKFCEIRLDCETKYGEFQFQVSQQEVFSRRLVVQAFFRIVVNPIFDECDFFRSRFLSSFR